MRMTAPVVATAAALSAVISDETLAPEDALRVRLTVFPLRVVDAPEVVLTQVFLDWSMLIVTCAPDVELMVITGDLIYLTLREAPDALLEIREDVLIFFITIEEPEDEFMIIPSGDFMSDSETRELPAVELMTDISGAATSRTQYLGLPDCRLVRFW